MSVRTLEDLSFCVILSVLKFWLRFPLVMQLNIFAIQLYLKSYKKYLSICRFLELCFRPPDEQIQIAYDSFIASWDRSKFDAIIKSKCPFTISPVGFLRILIALGRKGQSFEKSYFGKILHGELLARKQFRE